MIKVTARAQEYNKETKLWGEVKTVKEHKDGVYASVFNGILTIYGAKDITNKLEQTDAIAGYEASIWTSWEKV